MEWSIGVILIAGCLASVIAIGDQKPQVDDSGGTRSSYSTSSVPDINATLKNFTDNPLRSAAKQVNLTMEIFPGNISDNLAKELSSTDKPINLETPKLPMALAKKERIHGSSKPELSRKFPGALHTIDTFGIFSPYSLPESFYYELLHEKTTISTKLFKTEEEHVVPINSTVLVGQGLLWIHDEDEVLEYFVGRDIYPFFIKEFKALFVTKPVNGIPRRLHVLWYSDGERSFTYEPDLIYLPKNTVKVDSIAKEELGVQYPGGIKHHLYELENIIYGKEQLVLKVRIAADFSFSKRIASLTPMNDSGTDIEQELITIEKTKFYLKNLVTLSNSTMTKAAFEKFRVSLEVSEIFVARAPEETQFMEDSKVNDSTIDADRAMHLYVEKELEKKNTAGIGASPDYVMVILTGYQLESKGQPLTVMTSGLGCDGVVMMTHQEFHTSSEELLHYFGHALGIPHDNASDNCTEGFMSEDFHGSTVRHPSTFSSCSIASLENIVEDLLKNQEGRCLVRNNAGIVNEKTEYDGAHPGQVFSLDQQCEMTFGPGYIACWPNSKHDVCKMLDCAPTGNAKDEGCLTLPSMRAMEGSSCSNKSWCLEMECRHDLWAPEYGLKIGNSQTKRPGRKPEQESHTFWISLTTLMLMSLYVVVRLCSWAVRRFREKRHSGMLED